MTRTVLAAVVAAALATTACSSQPADDGAPASIDVSGSPVRDVGDVDVPGSAAESDTSDAPSQSEPAETTPAGSGPPGVEPVGFSTVIVEITKVDGEVCEVCMWLADDAAERGEGLMGVTSLGTPEAMAFVFPQPTAGSFFMFQTVTPLSIAWFGVPDGDAGGVLVSTADMEPCFSDNSLQCDRFAPGGDYVLAIEVFQGDLASIGITAGARARVLLDTEAVDCPLV